MHKRHCATDKHSRGEKTGGKLMGFDGGNQKLEFDMVEKQNNWKNQRDCDMSRVKAMKAILSHIDRSVSDRGV